MTFYYHYSFSSSFRLLFLWYPVFVYLVNPLVPPPSSSFYHLIIPFFRYFALLRLAFNSTSDSQRRSSSCRFYVFLMYAK
jgi:hypothetical protein